MYLNLKKFFSFFSFKLEYNKGKVFKLYKKLFFIF